MSINSSVFIVNFEQVTVYWVQALQMICKKINSEFLPYIANGKQTMNEK